MNAADQMMTCRKKAKGENFQVLHSCHNGSPVLLDAANPMQCNGTKNGENRGCVVVAEINFL